MKIYVQGLILAFIGNDHREERPRLCEGVSAYPYAATLKGSSSKIHNQHIYRCTVYIALCRCRCVHVGVHTSYFNPPSFLLLRGRVSGELQTLSAWHLPATSSLYYRTLDCDFISQFAHPSTFIRKNFTISVNSSSHVSERRAEENENYCQGVVTTSPLDLFCASIPMCSQDHVQKLTFCSTRESNESLTESWNIILGSQDHQISSIWSVASQLTLLAPMVENYGFEVLFFERRMVDFLQLPCKATYPRRAFKIDER